jgi:hypothetical protein
MPTASGLEIAPHVRQIFAPVVIGPWVLVAVTLNGNLRMHAAGQNNRCPGHPCPAQGSPGLSGADRLYSTCVSLIHNPIQLEEKR